MSPRAIELVEPTEGEKTWRIRISNQGTASRSPMRTSIPLWMATKDVIESLLKSYSRAKITGPAGQPMNPKPPGKLPRLHSSQPSEP